MNLSIVQIIYLSIMGFMLSGVAFAHGGSHDSQENSCLLTIGDVHVRFNGYQIKSKIPDRRYCHFFPEKGSVTIKLELLDTGYDIQNISLKMLSISSFINAVLNPLNPFDVVLKHNSFRDFKSEAVSTQRKFINRGIYALDIILLDSKGDKYQQRFLFLVGFPIVKMLIGVSLLLLLVLCISAFRQSRRVKDNR